MRFFPLFMLFILACSKPKPTPEIPNINKAVNVYYEKNECFLPMKFPVQIAAATPQSGYLSLVRSNILVKTSSISDFKTSDGIVKGVKTNIYTLSDSAKPYYIENKGLRIASLYISDLFGVSETSKYLGYNMVVIDYELENLAYSPWFNEEVSSYFNSKIPFPIPSKSIRKQEKLLLKGDTWVHERMF